MSDAYQYNYQRFIRTIYRDIETRKPSHYVPRPAVRQRATRRGNATSKTVRAAHAVFDRVTKGKG